MYDEKCPEANLFEELHSHFHDIPTRVGQAPKYLSRSIGPRSGVSAGRTRKKTVEESD